jgi:hypothetical protein
MKVFSGIDNKNRVRENYTYWAMIYPKNDVKAYSFKEFSDEFMLMRFIEILKAQGTHGGFGMIQNSGIQEKVTHI